jgi:transcriptional regulator with XRE-family HTH domain
MLYLADNLKYLRTKKNLSQREAAEGMGMPRDRYRKYEDGSNTPPAEMLLVISRYYHMSIDILLTVNVREISTDNLLKLEGNRLLLPIMVDRNNDNLIELVPYKARAGYLTGYADPNYISDLPQLHLPFLGPGKHRVFPVEGDSMPPHEDGSYIVSKFVETLGEVVDGKTYIVITKDEGIVYKRLNKNGKNALVLESDNTFYEPYQVKASEILELWEFEYSIDKNDRKTVASENGDVREMFMELKREMQQLKQKLNA